MALIECPKCGKQISDLANVCVSCGYQLKKPEKTTVENPAPENCDSTATGPAAPFPSGGNSSANRKKWTIIGIAVAVVAAIALLLILTLPGDRETNPPASAPENTESATATPEPPATETPAPVTAAPEMPVPETPVPETTVSENTVLVNNVLENSIPAISRSRTGCFWTV